MFLLDVPWVNKKKIQDTKKCYLLLSLCLFIFS